MKPYAVKHTTINKERRTGVESERVRDQESLRKGPRENRGGRQLLQVRRLLRAEKPRRGVSRPKQRGEDGMTLREMRDRLKKTPEITEEQMQAVAPLYCALDLRKDDFCRIVDAAGLGTLLERAGSWRRRTTNTRRSCGTGGKSRG